MNKALFLKENILKSKQNDKTGKNVLKLVKVSSQNEFLFEKISASFAELIDFLNNEDDVLVITGFSLCGKSLLGSVIPKLIHEKTIFYKFKCSAASTLDDLLLKFFDIFKDYAMKKLVSIPKIDIQNFQQRINIYLTKCENPIIILLDGLNEIKSSKNKDDIMNFISQVLNYKNIKLVITTRSFDISDLKNINLRLSTSIIKPLTQNDLNDYCLKNIINSDGIEDFYKLSRGHYFNLFYAMNYLQPTNTSIKEFVTEIQASKKSIDEIVITKNLSLIPDSYNNILWVIVLSDFGMPVSNLISIPEFEEEQISFLEKRGIIEVFNGCIYMRDYFKSEIIKSIEPIAKINIIKGIIKFLEAQLPLKPSLRELKLSRNTIRNEIERLNSIINRTNLQKIEKNKTTFMNILGYSKQFKTNWDGFDEIIMPKKDNEKEIKNESLKENIIENNNVEERKTDVFAPPKNENPALSLAKRLKNKYSYSDALVQYSDALSISVEKHNTQEIIDILKDIAQCYCKLGDYSNSIENYGKAHEIAKKENMVEECYEILLNIAQIYSLTYKKDLATEIYKDIIAQDNLNENIKHRAELNLFEINFSNMKLNDIINKYNELLENFKDDNVISAKIHFRLGFLYDRVSSLENAVKHYKESIKNCEDYNKNENISSCYYNLAEIYNDKKDYTSALNYYLKSYAIDEMTNSIENILITVKKIAQIYERQNNKLAKEYFEKALQYAKTLNDNYPVACAVIDLGDYYYRQKQDMKALKIYLSVKKLLSNQITKENEIAIDDRINDLRVRMGKDIADSIIREFS